MSRFYDEIFSQPRKQLTLLSCSVGSELHEMGVRMLSDLFEYQGWDTYYMGASVPDAAILNAIRERKPDLVALSVTMPPYLPVCEQLVRNLRSEYPELKIAVGGQAFRTTQALWEKWPIDHYASSASALIQWASSTFG
nr:cobalamin B12-binding domain-containing protein [Anaerotalea alkaliphila]